jgi:hypothetical protein
MLAEIAVAIYTGGEHEDKYRWDVTTPQGERLEVKAGVTSSPHFGTDDGVLRADAIVAVEMTETGLVLSASKFAVPPPEDLVKHGALQGNRRTIRRYKSLVRDGFNPVLTRELQMLVEASRA